MQPTSTPKPLPLQILSSRRVSAATHHPRRGPSPPSPSRRPPRLALYPPKMNLSLLVRNLVRCRCPRALLVRLIFVCPQCHSKLYLVNSDFGVLPTPSPEIQHASVHFHNAESHEAYRLPSWEVLRADGSAASVPVSGAGAKRSFDTYSVDEFFTDVKKRRVNPSYDSSTSSDTFLSISLFRC